MSEGLNILISIKCADQETAKEMEAKLSPVLKQYLSMLVGTGSEITVKREWFYGCTRHEHTRKTIPRYSARKSNIGKSK